MARRRLQVTLAVTVGVAVLLAYVGTYLVMSANGRYEPCAFGIDHVKVYMWAPSGYPAYKFHNAQWDGPVATLFAPAHLLDRKFWHEDAWSDYDGPYPIHW